MAEDLEDFPEDRIQNTLDPIPPPGPWVEPAFPEQFEPFPISPAHPPHQTHDASPPERRPLFSIVEDIHKLVTADDGFVSEETDALLANLDLEFSDKAEAYVAVMRRLDLEQDAFLELKKFYDRKAQAREAQRDNLRARLHVAMSLLGVDELKTPTTKVWISETTAVELADDFVAVNSGTEFVVTVPQSERPVQKVLIRSALEAGVEIHGAKLVTNKHLRHS